MNDKELRQEQKTIASLQALKDTPPRDPQQAAQGRRAFLAQAQKISEPSVSIPLFQRLINVFSPPKIQLRLSTLTMGIILSFLLLTFSSSAYATRQAKPDQFLYPFKLWLENSRLSLTKQTDRQIDLHLVFAEERLKELAAQDKVYSNSQINQALNNLSGHLDALRSLLGEGQDDDLLQDRLEEIQDQYERLEKQKDDDQRDEEQDDGSSDRDQEKEDGSEEKDRKEDQSEPEDDSESNRGKQEDSSDEESTDDEKEDEPKPTDEPDDDSSNNSGSSNDQDPTKTPKPDEDD